MSAASKRIVSVRANQQQVSTLREAFSQTQIPQPQDLQRLVTETGLTEKWILGWFQRERRKFKAKNVKEEFEDPNVTMGFSNTSNDMRSDSEVMDNPLSFSRPLKPPRKRLKTHDTPQKQSPKIKAEVVESTLPSDSISVPDSASIPLASILPNPLEPSATVNSPVQVHIPASISKKSTKQPKRGRGKQKSANYKTKNMEPTVVQSETEPVSDSVCSSSA
ncbi:hypothetical protein L218DRAFT_370401 [Marasmius fiardii PR-910]|nr:hypothetical protein L218DRAFT_370401 [Marasmius fiardii PR-910]